MVWITTLYCGPAARTGKRRGREGSGLYPERAVLGIREGSSPALASQVGRLTALLPSYEVDDGKDSFQKFTHRAARNYAATVAKAGATGDEVTRGGMVNGSGSGGWPRSST